MVVASHKGFDRSGRQKLDFMPHHRQLSGPVLCTTTAFHTHQARLPAGKGLQKPGTLELLAHNLACVHINPVQLKHALGDIDSDNSFANIFVGPSGLPVEITATIHLGHFDAVGP